MSPEGDGTGGDLDELDRIGELPRARPAPDLTVDDNGVTFLIVSAAGPLFRLPRRLRVELGTGRRVAVVATPSAASWLEEYGVIPVIERVTGFPVRSAMPHPTTPTFTPMASSVLVSPCSLNTLTKWAGGHADNLAISLLCEAVGRGVPTRAEVSISGPYGALPAATEALDRLRSLGVRCQQAYGADAHALLDPLPPEVVKGLTADRSAGSGQAEARSVEW